MANKHSSSQRRSPQKQKSRKGKRGWRIALVLLEILMIGILSVGCYAVNLLGTLDRGELNEEDVYVYGQNGAQPIVEALTQSAADEQTTAGEAQTESEETGWTVDTAVIETEEEYDFMAHQETMNGYWNILILGVDARLDQPLSGGDYRADVIMICSINAQTKNVKLVSVYRDTIVKMYSSDEYIKVNSGVFYGINGSIAEMLNIINLNFDMNIKDVVIVNWAAVALAVNELGGLWLDISQEEIDRHIITGYLTEVVEETGIATNGQFTTGGLQWCDGPKVVAYCRNRKTTGSDFARTGRQREVINLMLQQAKAADLGTLLKLVKIVFSNMYTTLTFEELCSLAADINKYTIGETTGFPETNTAVEYAGQLASVYGLKDVVLAQDLASNVKQLHTFLFGDDGYQLSQNVNTISANLQYLAK